MAVSPDAERMFRNEQRRHHNAATNAIQSIADSVANIQRFHEHGQNVAHELRNLTSEVLRAFERATAYEALKEVEFIVGDDPTA